jgi:hypothetical protein
MPISPQYFGAVSPFQLRSGYANRGKPGELMTFRNPANVAEMFNHCNTNSHIWVRTQHNTARQVKVNGAVRTWKRDPNRIEVPCKYGLYEYFTLQARDITDVLIPV